MLSMHPFSSPSEVHITITSELPEKATNPNIHYWYLFMATFSPSAIQAWAEQNKGKKEKGGKKKEEKKEEKEEDEFDPFADDDAPKEKAKPVEKPKPKAAKPKPVAKSIVVFDVKIYDQEVTNLDDLAKKILALEINGLVWNNSPKKLDVAFGIQKLQMGCVIEDDKVLTDDIFDQILAWEDDVQSVDMVSMQKL